MWHTYRTYSYWGFKRNSRLDRRQYIIKRLLFRIKFVFMIFTYENILMIYKIILYYMTLVTNLDINLMMQKL